MKTLINACWLLCGALFFSSCPEVPEIDTYMMALCFRDAQGNNIVESIEPGELILDVTDNVFEGIVNPDAYSLDIVSQNYINGEVVPGPDESPVLYDYSLTMFKSRKLGFCLASSFTRFRENNNVRKVIYQLKCPSVFRDKKVHEFVTYWELSENIYAKCYRMEFEGQVIIPQTNENEYRSYGVVTLNYVYGQ